MTQAQRQTESRPRRRRRRPRRRGRARRLLLLAALCAVAWSSRGLFFPSLPPPQLVLVLGGDVERERVGAEVAKRDGLPVMVSGGSNPEYAHWLFRGRGLDDTRVLLDYRATDTLSNFTSVVDDLKRSKIRHVVLVTSSDHMDRALMVGRVVAGSRGIGLTPLAVPCGERCVPEDWRKVWGDGLRATLWVVSGRDLRDWAAERFGPLLEEVRGR
jgi:uncharacterized SAM-binding protein YcdF (DUF218 family)